VQDTTLNSGSQLNIGKNNEAQIGGVHAANGASVSGVKSTTLNSGSQLNIGEGNKAQIGGVRAE
ncbi:MAG: hypothetical protein WCI95_05370, partial [bacterium]